MFSTSPKAIIELQTGVIQETPLEWPFNQETNEEQKTDIRLSELFSKVFILNIYTVLHPQVTLGVSENSSDWLCALFILEHSKKLTLILGLFLSSGSRINFQVQSPVNVLCYSQNT